MSKVNCPYCGQENDEDITTDYHDEDNETQCSSCGKTFMFDIEVIHTLIPRKTDCLNGGEHKYEPQNVHPKHLTQMFCVMCNDIRSPTPEERLFFGLYSETNFRRGNI